MYIGPQQATCAFKWAATKLLLIFFRSLDRLIWTGIGFLLKWLQFVSFSSYWYILKFSKNTPQALI